MFSNNIVIVTHINDVKLAGLCIDALEKFLITPSVIHLYVNEPGKVLYDECVNYLSSIIKNITNHLVIIQPQNDIKKYAECQDYSGYKSQQLIKLFAGIDQPYLILDPKDILVNKITAEKLFKTLWPFIASWDSVQAPFDVFCRELESWYGHRKLLRGCLTPQLIDPDIVMKIVTKGHNSKDEFCRWFMSFRAPSEFYLYDYARRFYTDCEVKLYDLPEPKILYWRDPKEFDLNQAKKFLLDPESFMMKIHPNSLVNENYDQLRVLLNQRFSKS